MVSQYKKNPIVIQALLFTGENRQEVLSFTNCNAHMFIEKEFEGVERQTCVIRTGEGNLVAFDGDYIIKGIKGDFYPCPPDTFAATYTEHPCKTPKPGGVEPVELSNELITQNYTYIEHESEFVQEFNAPHDFEVRSKESFEVITTVNFQKGPIKENGVNGCANEDLIAMVIARLNAFQDSPYKCRENAIALTKLEESLMWLRKRTLKRVTAGTEGTSNV